MPGFDRTGPQGLGPMTGGARGLCNPRATSYGSQFAGGFGYGRGFGMGRGYGRGFGRGMGMGYGPEYGPRYPLKSADEIAGLKADADYMKSSLDAISRRIEELEKKD
ncbi:MAG: DUF5320 domain-containing protein [Desulfobacterales bacterium]|uniref:DUF5320 domain-containing protein n=1 Tax=Candidatus Desulfaltia bathyphila TaxID=2841697 RepID=A0A8J6N4M7_9BACT|nr:DUF5320 domain-containing protein [Candidatus Desulfaltia bathyphila]MBL7195914.1 DUF5320 domain-containing protein [Desulfobacterales bacterium]MBL7207952.1 DUF5320 domain-containing protein [Desulfobacterales bacterium]